MVFYALKDKMKTDEDERVRYEAAKSLILVGKPCNIGSCVKIFLVHFCFAFFILSVHSNFIHMQEIYQNQVNLNVVNTCI